MRQVSAAARLLRVAGLLLLALLPAQAGSARGAAAGGPTHHPQATLIVNSTADSRDANPGDGVCADALGACTLRAAVDTANALAGDDTINVPAGVYALTRSGIDDSNNAGDLDINPGGGSGALTIVGAGPLQTFIQPGTGVAGRLLHVLNHTLTLQGVTLRDATEGGPGGALLAASLTAVQAPAVVLTDVAVRNNRAAEGGGLFARAVTATRVLLVGNRTTGFSGGAAQVETLILRDSQVLSNTAAGVSTLGGGLYGESMDIFDTTVRGNTSSGSGGGIYCTGCRLERVVLADNRTTTEGGGVRAEDLSIRHSQVFSNVVTAGDGGGVWATGLVMENTLVQANEASASGGGAFVGVGQIRASTFADNEAVLGSGGGLFAAEGQAALADSVLFGNRAGANGGGLAAVRAALSGSAVLANLAQTSGGGLFLFGSALQTTPSTLITSTVASNGAADGGGVVVTGQARLHADRVLLTENVAVSEGGAFLIGGSGRAEIAQASIYENQAESGGALAGGGLGITITTSSITTNTVTNSGGGLLIAGAFTLVNSTLSGNAAVLGGGIFVNSIAPEVVTLQGVTVANNRVAGNTGAGGGIFVNTGAPNPLLAHVVIANNRRVTPLQTTDNDCVGALTLTAPTLIRAHSAGTCPLTLSPPGALLTGEPLIGPLADNGGWGLTHLPSAASPVVDAGQPAPCGLTTDQRLAVRTDDCDLGAAERTSEEPRPTRTPMPVFTATSTLTPTPPTPAASATPSGGLTPTHTPPPGFTPLPPNPTRVFLPSASKP